MPFTKVHETGKRKAVVVAEQILQLIREGEFRQGDKLPSENQIAALTGVGRPVIREALSALHIVGIIRTRSGDGSYVELDSSNLVQARLLSLLTSRTNPFETLQARRYLEGGIVELATEVVTFDELAKLNNLIDDAEEKVNSFPDKIYGEEFYQIHYHHDHVFHTLIASITGNVLLIDHMNFYCHIMGQDKIWPNLYKKFYSIKSEVVQALSEHRAIVKAMEFRKVAEAKAAVHRHFDNVGTRILKYESDYHAIGHGT
jgi:GntR family transcriptional repressor for pyruvate dehydrogenase complex